MENLFRKTSSASTVLCAGLDWGPSRFLQTAQTRQLQHSYNQGHATLCLQTCSGMSRAISLAICATDGPEACQNIRKVEPVTLPPHHVILVWLAPGLDCSKSACRTGLLAFKRPQVSIHVVSGIESCATLWASCVAFSTRQSLQMKNMSLSTNAITHTGRHKRKCFLRS